MVNLNYLDTFNIGKFIIPSYSDIEAKLGQDGPKYWDVSEVLNPIETFLYDNESANREDANRQRRYIGQIVQYVIDNMESK